MLGNKPKNDVTLERKVGLCMIHSRKITYFFKTKNNNSDYAN